MISSRIEGALDDVKTKYIEGNDILKCRKKSEKLGFVGDVLEVNFSGIAEKVSEGYTVIVSPMGGDKDGNLYNVNADLSASSLAKSLQSELLVYFTKVKGILDSGGNPISSINKGGVGRLIEQGVISGGMIPKVNSALDALTGGVRKVMIGSTAVQE